MEMEKLMQMSIDDVLSVKDFLLIAQEAKATAELIQKSFKSSFSEVLHRIPVWCDREGQNFEYLTDDWVWQAKYTDWFDNIKCDAKGVYELFKAEHLMNWNLISKTDPNYYKISHMAKTCKYFRKFVNGLKK